MYPNHAAVGKLLRQPGHSALKSGLQQLYIIGKPVLGNPHNLSQGAVFRRNIQSAVGEQLGFKANACSDTELLLEFLNLLDKRRDVVRSCSPHMLEKQK